MNKLSERILAMENHGVTSYQGNYDYYTEKKAELSMKSSETQNNSSTPKSTAALSYKEKKEKEALIRKLKNTLTKTEEEISKTEQEISELEEKLLLPEVASDYVKAGEVSALIDEKNEILSELYELWEETDEKLSLQ